MAKIRSAAARDLGDLAQQIAQNEPFDETERERMVLIGQEARAALEEPHGTIA
jgi:F-type H+-transporting ATPase subunit alpha